MYGDFRPTRRQNIPNGEFHSALDFNHRSRDTFYPIYSFWDPRPDKHNHHGYPRTRPEVRPILKGDFKPQHRRRRTSYFNSSERNPAYEVGNQTRFFSDRQLSTLKRVDYPDRNLLGRQGYAQSLNRPSPGYRNTRNPEESWCEVRRISRRRSPHLALRTTTPIYRLVGIDSTPGNPNRFSLLEIADEPPISYSPAIEQIPSSNRFYSASNRNRTEKSNILRIRGVTSSLNPPSPGKIAGITRDGRNCHNRNINRAFHSGNEEAYSRKLVANSNHRQQTSASEAPSTSAPGPSPVAAIVSSPGPTSMKPINDSVFVEDTSTGNAPSFTWADMEPPMHLEQESSARTEETISKLIFNFEVQRAYAIKHLPHSSEKQPMIPRLPQIHTYSDASDSFDYFDDSFFQDDFLGHTTESDRRLPISYPEEIRKSKFNSAICCKADFVTLENCLPTDNLNTQLKIDRKSQKKTKGATA